MKFRKAYILQSLIRYQLKTERFIKILNLTSSSLRKLEIAVYLWIL